MQRSVTETLLSIPDQGYPVTLSTQLKQHAQQDGFFHLALNKSQRTQALARHLGGQAPQRLFIGANMSGFDYAHPAFEVSRLAPGFFSQGDAAAQAAKREQLDGAIVIVNNNDVGRDNGAPFYADFFSRCERTIFAVWDWDNHHWLDNSSFAAAHADVYAPAHHENLYLLTRYNPSTLGPVYCATVQWSKAFLADHIGDIIGTERTDQPLGMHVPYGSFTYRNRVVTTLSQHFPKVGFSSHSFHHRTAEDRLLEWCQHKLHWIVPVLNDVPIRLFDALITGGIPLVPESMRYLPPVRDIDRRHIAFYGPEDIVNPGPLVQRALRLFDEGGLEGMVARHRHALAHHHGQDRVDDILAGIAEKFEFPLAQR